MENAWSLQQNDLQFHRSTLGSIAAKSRGARHRHQAGRDGVRRGVAGALREEVFAAVILRRNSVADDSIRSYIGMFGMVTRTEAGRHS